MPKITYKNTKTSASIAVRVLKKAAQRAQDGVRNFMSSPVERIENSQAGHFYQNIYESDLKKTSFLNPGAIKRTSGFLDETEISIRKNIIQELIDKRPVYHPSPEGKEDFRRIRDVAAENEYFFELSQLPSCDFKRLRKLLYVEGRKFQLGQQEVQELLEADKKILNNIFDRNLLKSIEGRTEDLSAADCIKYGAMSNNKWQKVTTSGLLKDYDKKGNAFNANQIEVLYSATPEYQQKFVSILTNKERPVNFAEALQLAKLSETEWHNVKDLFTMKYLTRDFDFSINAACNEENAILTEKFIDINYLTKSLVKRTPVEIGEIKKILGFSRRKHPIGIGNAVDIATKKTSSTPDGERLFERVEKLGLLGSENMFGCEIPQNHIVKLAQNSDENLKEIADYKNFLCKNKSILQQHNEQALAEEDIMETVLSYYNPLVVKTAGDDVLRHASSLKYDGLKEFLNLCCGLKFYPKELLLKIEETLKLLSHPEQRLEKLKIILSIGQKQFDENVTVVMGLSEPPTKMQIENINKILDFIKPSKTSVSQLNKAIEIMSCKSVSQKESVELFIKEFNVPQNRRERVRNLLKVKSADEQLEDVEQKLKALTQDTKLSEAKKRLVKGQLELEKAEILYNPETASRFKMTESNKRKLEALIEAHINLPLNNREFAEKVKRLMYESLKLSPSKKLIESLDYDSKYLHTLFASSNKKNFLQEFEELITLLDSDPSKKLSVLREELQHNKQTRKLFEQYKLNYQKWSTYNENLKSKFEVNIKAKDVLDSASKNFAQEIFRLKENNIQNTNASNLFAKLNETVENLGCYLDYENQCFAKKDGSLLSQKDLNKIYKAIEETVNGINGTPIADDLMVRTFESHLPVHKKNIKALKDVKDMKEEFFVRLSDVDDVSRNLFFGNHVGCCTSVGSSNGFAAPQHLMNSFVRGIEIVDEAGNSFGNSMCYFADIDGKVHLVIDSFEANGKLGADKGVTKAVADYAKLVVKEMGQPDVPVIFGPNYNKISLEDYKLTQNHTAKIIGKSAEETYLDLIKDYHIKMDGDTAQNVRFYLHK